MPFLMRLEFGASVGLVAGTNSPGPDLLQFIQASSNLQF